MKHIVKMAIFLFCLSLIYGVNLYAAEKNPCADDMAKFCKGIKSGSTDLMICFEKHENELSAACKAYEAKMGGPKAERREKITKLIIFRRACTNDIVKLCKDAKPEQGGIMKCLKAHGSELSSDCSNSIAAVEEE